MDRSLCAIDEYCGDKEDAMMSRKGVCYNTEMNGNGGNRIEEECDSEGAVETSCN